jgi:DNA-binding response OmpR family regulator
LPRVVIHAADASGQSTGESVSVGSAPTPRCALVVDDEPALAALFAAFLGRLGFAVSIGHAEPEAAELLRSRRWDLLLTDLQLGGGAGEEGLSLIRLARSLYPQTRTILVSGSLAADIAEPATRDADRFLPKPVEFAALSDQVRALFPPPA